MKSYGKSLLIPCDCGWAPHLLKVQVEITPEYNEVIVSVINEPHSLRERLRAVWAAIRGNHHALSEIVVDRHSLSALIGFFDDVHEALILAGKADAAQEVRPLPQPLPQTSVAAKSGVTTTRPEFPVVEERD